MHHGELVENPAELFVRVDGNIAVLAEHLELQEAAIPTVRKLEVFEQAGVFLADGEFVCKRVDGRVEIRVAEVQKSVTGVCRILQELLGGKVFELNLDVGDCFSAGGCREGRELVQDALQKAKVPVLGRCAGACFPEAGVTLGGVGDFVESYGLRGEFGAVCRGGGDGFDGIAEEILCEELVECVVDVFFARDFKTRCVACFEFLNCCHFSSFIYFLFKYTQNCGQGNMYL